MSTRAMYGNPLPAMDFAAMKDCEWRHSTAPPSVSYVLPVKKHYTNTEGEWTKKRKTLATAIKPSSFAAVGGRNEASTPTLPLRSRSNSPDRIKEIPSPLPRIEKILRIQLPTEAFELGMIIEAPLMEEDFMYGASLTAIPNNPQSDLSISSSHYGFVHTKLRKFVVVALFAQHYLALPMYTHNGDGLEKKPNPNEFVSVLDMRNMARNRRSLDFQPLSDHPPLVAEMRPESQMLYSKTTVHVAYAVARNYQLRVNYLGELEAESTERLLGLFKAAVE